MEDLQKKTPTPDGLEAQETPSTSLEEEVEVVVEAVEEAVEEEETAEETLTIEVLEIS